MYTIEQYMTNAPPTGPPTTPEPSGLERDGKP